jgi:hypothetical protein
MSIDLHDSVFKKTPIIFVTGIRGIGAADSMSMLIKATFVSPPYNNITINGGGAKPKAS